MFLELALETLKKRDGVGCGTCKARNDFVVEQAASLARGVLHNVIAHGHLAIGDEHRFIVFAHAEHGGAMHLRAPRSPEHPMIILADVPAFQSSVPAGD